MAKQHVAPELYLNREVGQLEFNRRVLALAEDRSVPPLERLRYLCIVDSNLDEFFEIRVAGLKEEIAADSPPGPDGMRTLLAEDTARWKDILSEGKIKLQ